MVRRLVYLGVMSCVFALAQAQPTVNSAGLDVRLESVFQNAYDEPANAPFHLIVENTGPDQTIAVSYRRNGTEVVFNDAVPTGTTKRYSLTLRADNLFGVKVRSSAFELPINQPKIPGSSASQMLYVGDEPASLRSVPQVLGKKFRDAQVSPENFPRDLAATHGVQTIFLGNGSERLTDDQVNSIQNYCLQGGLLVVSAGPTSLIAKDPRWSNVLPGQINGTSHETANGGKLSQGAYQRPFGLGVLAMLPYSIEEASTQRSQKFDDFLKRLPIDRKRATLRELGFAENDRESLLPYESGQTAVGLLDIRVSPPNPKQVFWFFFSYIFIAVPLTYFILKKANRLPLTWYAVPLIAMAYGAYFVVSAKQLYQIPEKRVVRLTLIEDQKSNQVTAYGQFAGFFPLAGTYPIAIPGVTFAEIPGNEFQNEATTTVLQQGPFQIPVFRSGSLSLGKFFMILDPPSVPSPKLIAKHKGNEVVLTLPSGEILKRSFIDVNLKLQRTEFTPRTGSREVKIRHKKMPDEVSTLLVELEAKTFDCAELGLGEPGAFKVIIHRLIGVQVTR